MIKKYEELKQTNEILSKELEMIKHVEEKKLNQLDEEHDNEIQIKQVRYQENLMNLTQENNMLKALGKKKDEEMSQKDDELKKRQFKITLLEEAKVSLEDNLNVLKQLLVEKEKEFISIQQKALEHEKALQEEKAISGFCTNLKNELYKKNTEIMGYYNKQNTFISDLKSSAFNSGKELVENLRLLENTTREVNHQKHIISEFKSKLEEKTKNLAQLQSYLDALLYKIYDIFQISDRHKLLSALKNLYNEYINDKVVKNFEKIKLNNPVKNELSRQIEFLQNSIDSLAEIKEKKDEIKRHEISMKTKQNAELIMHLNDMKKELSSLEKENVLLKNQNFMLSRTVENLKRKCSDDENSKQNRLAQSVSNIESFKNTSGVLLPDIDNKINNSSELINLNVPHSIENIKKPKKG